MPDLRLSQLTDYLACVDAETTPAEFWEGWDRIAGTLAQEVWSDDVQAELREAFTELLSAADDAGWVVPDHQMQS